MAASVQIGIPTVVYVKAVPDFSYNKLAKQPNPVTLATPSSGFHLGPQAEVSSRAPAMKVCMLTVILHKHVPNGFEELLGGGFRLVNGVKTVSQEGKDFQRKIVPKIITSLFTEKYGPGTFFRNNVRGTVCTLNTKTALTNWILQARFYDIIPGGETPAESAVRQANAQAYRDAVTTLTSKRIDTYTNAHRIARDEATHAEGSNKKHCEARVAFFAYLMANPPVAEMSAEALAALNTRDQVTAAEQTPLFFLPKKQRLCIWAKMLTDDVFATFFEKSCEVVDVHRLRQLTRDDEPNPYRKMWTNMWVQTCDLFHRGLIGQEDSIERCRVFARDVRIRHNTGCKIPSLQVKTYARVRALHNDLGLNRPEFGTWKGVHILEASLQGYKRGFDDGGTRG